MTSVKLRREAAQLKRKAVGSLRRAAAAFNDLDDEGRATTVLLHFQHAFEMLLKAALIQRGQPVFDARSGRAIGFDKCVNLGREHLALTTDETGTLRTLDALRDDEQHWMTTTSEGLLYLHCRAAVTLFDDLLQRVFDDRLVNHLPHRVLPISAEPPRDIQVLLDEEYTQIAQLLGPGHRKRPDARARIRALLAMEAHTRDEPVSVSRRDVDRVEGAIRAGGARTDVFPALSDIGTDVAGAGVQVTVRITKAESAVPVRLVGADEVVAAGAVREVDLQRKYHWTKQALADRLGLSTSRCLALRHHLGIEDDESCRHDFVFGRTVHRQYSDNAFTKMREELASGIDMEDVWRLNRPRSGSPPPRPRVT
jgi:Arc/MetJ family transcription regulator